MASPNYDLIWAQNSPLTPYEFSDAEYLEGWNTVGSTPPARTMFDALQRNADMKAQDLNTRVESIETTSGGQQRQEGQAYEVGQYATTSALPTGWYLKCIVAGNTSTNALVIPSPKVGDLVIDGSVTWQVLNWPYGQNVLTRSTPYAVGSIVFNPNLAGGLYLSCVTAGTTGTQEPTAALLVAIDGTQITDGTAVFTVNSIGAVRNSENREITMTWAALKTKIQAGDFSGIRIGDYKTITLTTGEVAVMEVAGIDQYYNCGDPAIGHHIDFISRDALAGGKQFNTTDTNNGTADENSPWLASALYQTLNNESTGIYSKLPSDLKPYIITKRALLEERYSAGGAVAADTGWAWKNAGKLWLPTEVEVFGHHTWSVPGYGTGGGGCNLQYPIFRYNGVIKGDGNGGSRCAWWELSADRTNATRFCIVSSHGIAGTTVASDTSIRAPLCFRIG